jgi:hypothetical protein
MSPVCSVIALFAGNCYTRAACRCASNCEAYVWFQHDGALMQWGRCSPVVECDMSVKVDWMSRADGMALITISNCSKFISYEETLRSTFMQSLPGI